MATKLSKTQLKKIAKFLGEAQEFKEYFSEIASDLEAACESKSDKWRESEAGERDVEAVSSLWDAISSMEEMIANLESVEGISDA